MNSGGALDRDCQEARPLRPRNSINSCRPAFAPARFVPRRQNRPYLCCVYQHRGLNTCYWDTSAWPRNLSRARNLRNMDLVLSGSAPGLRPTSTGEDSAQESFVLSAEDSFVKGLDWLSSSSNAASSLMTQASAKIGWRLNPGSGFQRGSGTHMQAFRMQLLISSRRPKPDPTKQSTAHRSSTSSRYLQHIS